MHGRCMGDESSKMLLVTQVLGMMFKVALYEGGHEVVSVVVSLADEIMPNLSFAHASFIHSSITHQLLPVLDGYVGLLALLNQLLRQQFTLQQEFIFSALWYKI